jgi:hypothetical protein
MMHHEKNLLNLEDTSEIDSDIESSKISFKLDDSQVLNKYNHVQKDLLKSLNKSHMFRLSEGKKRVEKREIKQ